jgi:hypothetical protein
MICILRIYNTAKSLECFVLNWEAIGSLLLVDRNLNVTYLIKS